MNIFLSKFKGLPLNDEQIASGMHLCYKNSKELYDEALLLKANGKYARALSLLILSLEELGKIVLLYNTILIDRNNIKAWNNFYKNFNSHDSKLSIWAFYGETFDKIGSYKFSDRYPHGFEPLLDKIKQLCFYVNYFDSNFIKPTSFAEENMELSEWLFSFTKKRINSFSKLHGTLDKSRDLYLQGKSLIRKLVKSKSEDEFHEIFKSYINDKLKKARTAANKA